MDVPFAEWSREQKDEFARRKMEEMKLRNEQFKLRHAEVERDRQKAEEKNSSVTSLKSLPKEKPVLSEEYEEENDFVPKPKVKEREWDKGKSSLDMEDWNLPKFNRQGSHWKSYSDKRFGKKEENWRVRSANASKDPQGSSSRFRASGKSGGNRKYSETSNQGPSNYRNDTYNTSSKQRGKGRGRGKSSFSTYKSFQNSKLGESRKKTFVDAYGSGSQSPSDPEMDQMKQSSKMENDRVWRTDGSNDIRHRRIRVEKWVKSISTASPDEGDSSVDINQENEYHNKNWSEYDEGFADDATKKYYKPATSFVANNKKCDAGNYASTEYYKPAPAFATNNEKWEEESSNAYPKYNNLQGCINKSRGNDRKSYDLKYQKDAKRKASSDKIKPRRESDTSDRVSSAKESDYPGYKKEKSWKISDSKSSDNSGFWEDDLEKGHGYTYGSGSWSKCKLPKPPLNNQFPDKVERNNDGNDYSKSTMQKATNKQWKNKSHSRCLSSSDYSGTYENTAVRKQSDRRSSWRRSDSHNLKKNKYTGSKLKTELKPSSSTFENCVPLVESHEISSPEYDPSILVQIERHTVQRTFFNNNFTAPQNENLDREAEDDEGI